MEIRIRAFRAIDDLIACQKFVKGHMEVLQRYGITMITSANIDWFINPHVVVVAAESPDGEVMYGGMRIHIHRPGFDLPIEKAVGKMDSSIFQMVRDRSIHGTGEFCGMWNSKEVAGKGVSYLLTSAATSMIEQLEVTSMFVLCAEYTVHMVERVGFEVVQSLGNDGTFYYPKLDLVATVLIKYNDHIHRVHDDERDLILDLKAQPLQERSVIPYKRDEIIQVFYQLQLQKETNLVELV